MNPTKTPKEKGYAAFYRCRCEGESANDGYFESKDAAEWERGLETAFTDWSKNNAPETVKLKYTCDHCGYTDTRDVQVYPYMRTISLKATRCPTCTKIGTMTVKGTINGTKIVKKVLDMGGYLSEEFVDGQDKPIKDPIVWPVWSAPGLRMTQKD